MRRAAAAALTVLAIAASAVSALPVQAFAATGPTAPPGYQLVISAPIPIPPSQQDSGGQVTCPAGTVPWGGGARFFGDASNFGESINTSAPTSNGWRARYNNTGTRPTDQFEVQAICAEQPPGYTVTFKTVDNPAGTQSAAVARCPLGTRLLSGGTLSTADTSDVTLLGAWPKGSRRFKSVIWNGSGTDQRLISFATCAQRPPGYTITSATGSDQGGPVINVSAAHCPSGTSLIGGGTHVTNSRPSVTLGNSAITSDTQWLSDVANSSPQPATVTTFAICAA